MFFANRSVVYCIILDVLSIQAHIYISKSKHTKLQSTWQLIVQELRPFSQLLNLGHVSWITSGKDVTQLLWHNQEELTVSAKYTKVQTCYTMSVYWMVGIDCSITIMKLSTLLETCCIALHASTEVPGNKFCAIQ